MVGWNYKSPLAFLPRYINGDEYIEYFLEPVVKPFFDKQRAEARRRGIVHKWIFQEDNEGAHGTKSSLNAPNNFKNEYKITQLRPIHPANSPDLSPIENIWHRLKQRVKKRKARNQAELQRFIKEEWDRVTIQEINKEILTMEDQVNQCIKHEGDVTEW
jgi:hypothetical protein